MTIIIHNNTITFTKKQCQTFFKMAAGGHFVSPIWPIVDNRKSLSIAFLAISDQYTTFLFEFFFKMAASTQCQIADLVDIKGVGVP